MVSAKVRGIGVAVIESKCGALIFPFASFLTNFLLCAVPNLCCSSTTHSARFLNLTVFWIKACVPINMGISPFATHFKSCARDIFVHPRGLTLEGNFLQPDPVMSPMLIGRYLKYSMKDSKCCAARISVGAM